MSTIDQKQAMPAETCRRFLGFMCWETGRDKANMLRFGALFLLWAVWHEGIAVLQINIEMSSTLAWVLAFSPVLPAIAAVLAYVKFLREADEMIRRIHITGLAVGFGAGLFVWMAIKPPILHDPTHRDVFMTAYIQRTLMFMAMIFGQAIGQFYASRRYR